MAHKIKIKRVPHINRDGSTGTKWEYVVRCKHRGKVCVEQKFSRRADALFEIDLHWSFVHGRRNSAQIRAKKDPRKLSVRLDTLKKMGVPETTLRELRRRKSTVGRRSTTGVYAA